MADLENARISAACISMAGDPEELEGLCAPVVPTDNLMVGAHSQVALNTISLGSPGVVVMADAGVEAYGENNRRESASVGGWGQPQGDEGSAYWIGLRAINACCRAADGVGPQTQLLPAILQHLELDGLKHLMRRINSGSMNRLEIAALLELVSLSAAQGDAVAKKLLRDAGRELGLLASSLLQTLDMQKESGAVGTIGCVFRAGRLVLRTFREVVQASAPHCRIVGPQAPICVGAAIEALEDIGVEIQEDTVACLLNTLPRLNGMRAL
jgi:N-acetylglucosamine kinase